MSGPFAHVGVLGAGAWGTALAQAAAGAGRAVTLWALEPEVVESAARQRENALYLPGIPLHPAIRVTGALEALADAQIILAVVPAQHMRATLARFARFARPDMPVVLCSKGVEQGTLALMTDVLRDTLPAAPAAVLSGPSFARDVAIGLPTAVTLACADAALGDRLVQTLGAATFRPYLVADLVGAEVGGAVKNVLAVACGLAEGRKLGESARAALITRGFAEMTRIGVAMGGRAETLAGLCGLGDLILTCSSRTSRNFALGVALGEGLSPADALSGKRSVAEGAASAPAIAALAAREGVDMPICQGVAAVLAGELDVDRLIAGLLARPFRAEGA
jgi:glycerol-3-phosphate dehydrogenase (NAD(P)+)